MVVSKFVWHGSGAGGYWAGRAECVASSVSPGDAGSHLCGTDECAGRFCARGLEANVADGLAGYYCLWEGIAAATPRLAVGGAADHIAGLPVSDVCISDGWPG